MKTPVAPKANDQWAVRYRPKEMSSFLCPDYIRSQIDTFTDKPPNAVLITGDFGCGKTTLAHIISKMLTEHSEDIHEINGVTDGGIENSRELIQQAKFKPKGKRRVFIIDEAHALSDKAVQAIMKPMEAELARVTWIICTNQPHKLNPAMASRCRNLVLTSPTFEQLDVLLVNITKLEKVKSYAGFARLKEKDEAAGKKMLRLLRKSSINAADGSPRVAITNYQSLCSIMLGSTRGRTAAMIGKELKDAALTLSGGMEAVDNILELVLKEPGEAAAAILNAKDQSLFNKVFYAARDSIAANRKSEVATRIFSYCIEAQHWSAFTSQSPSIFLASKLAMWAVNIEHRNKQGNKAK